MKIGVPKEVKNHECRVAITPIGVNELLAHGHMVLIERGAGVGSSVSDADYVAAGGTIRDTADDDPVASAVHTLVALKCRRFAFAVERGLDDELVFAHELRVIDDPVRCDVTRRLFEMFL